MENYELQMTLLRSLNLATNLPKKSATQPAWIASVQFSHAVVSDSLQPHGLQHARLPCLSPTPRVYSNSCPLSPMMPTNHLILCHPFLLLPSIFPIITIFSNESVFLHQLATFCKGGASASASVLPMNIQDSFPLGWTGWISLQSKGLSRVFSNTTVQKHQFFSAQLCL